MSSKENSKFYLEVGEKSANFILGLPLGFKIGFSLSLQSSLQSKRFRGVFYFQYFGCARNGTSFCFVFSSLSQFPRGQKAKNGRTLAARLSTVELISVA